MAKSTTVLGFAQMVDLSSPAARSQMSATLHRGQMRIPNMQNGGTARIGFKGSGLMSIKNGMLVIMINGTIGNCMD